MRFLFRLGDRREDGESLFETFEKLLDELGIQIEFNTEDDGIQEVTRNLAGIGGYFDEEAQDAARSSRHSRRASATSVYDAEDESTGVVRSNADSRASMSRLETSKKADTDTRPASRATTRPTERTSNPATPRKAPIIAPKRRLTALEWTQDLQQRQLNEKALTRNKQEDSRKDIAHGLPRLPQTNKHSQAGNSFSGNTNIGEIGAPFSEAFRRHPFILGDKEQFYATSRTQLLRDADTFQSYRIRSVARDAVEKWCYAAMEAKNQHEYMHRIALAHDKEILLRQAFEHWRLRLHERKKAVQTKQYFENLERRAERARDLYLLTKAFTHWSQCAEDEALRTSLARQHVLRIKYFNAWKDLTIATRNKAHLQRQQKYFGHWRQRYIQIITNDIKADLAYQRYLLRSAYWHWFWGFCEARAPEWQARRLKQRLLFKWVAAFRTTRQGNHRVTLDVERAAKKHFILKWLKKVRKRLHNQDVAVTYSRQTLTAGALKTWVRVCKHGPLTEQVSNMVDWRVAGATFATLVNRYQLRKQADSLSHLRLMRNAWTQWNDRLRWQTLTRRINDRHMLEALYKWTLAERLNLLTRLSNERLKETYLLKLRDQWSFEQTQRNDASRTIETQLTRRSLHLILLQWRLRCETLHQNEQIATKFHAPKVVYETLHLVNLRLQQIKVLNKMANYAAFYLSRKRFINRWHTATIESKRQKRRNAYMQIRRNTKMKLGSEMLQRWRLTTASARDMKGEANLFDHDRLLRLGATLFNQWRASYDLAVDQHFQATNYYDEHLLLRQFRIWTEHTTKLTELERTAFQTAHLYQQNLALSCLNRLRIRLIELKGPQATAENLRNRYKKRHFYNMVRHWQGKTAHRRDRPILGRAILSVKARRTKFFGQGDDGHAANPRAEEWMELDQGEWIPQPEAQSGFTSLSGYLNTPTKKAAHARALIQESTTPEGTPLQTRLRAQLNATPRTTQRAIFGRSIEMRKRDFPRLPIEGSGSTTVVDRDE